MTETCDKCHKEYDDNIFMVIPMGKIFGGVFEIHIMKSCFSKKEYKLCSDCAKEVENFITNEKGNNGKAD
jgi:hypothetical protein